MNKEDPVKKNSQVDVFNKLKTLVGDWQGNTPAGDVFKVNYRLSAAASVLVETWALPRGDEALTLYHMDGSNLMATHYCPHRNQPRLQLETNFDEQKIVFVFVNATNLQRIEESHQHQFDFTLFSPESFTRSETYIENGKSDSEAITYFRVR